MRKKDFHKIPPDVLHDAQLKLDEVIYLLEPYFIKLAPPERQALVKIETDSIKFLEVSHGIAITRQELFPSFIKAAIFCEEYFLAHELWEVIKKVNKLKDSIYDTEILIGNSALETAMAFYETVKIAAKRDIPGARVIYEELKSAFQSGRRKQRKAKVVKDEMQPELFESHELMGQSKTC